MNKTLIETLHEIEGIILPNHKEITLQLESIEPSQEDISDPTGFELNEEDWATLLGIANGSIREPNETVNFLAEAGLVRITESHGEELQLTPLATEWIGMLRDDHP